MRKSLQIKAHGLVDGKITCGHVVYILTVLLSFPGLHMQFFYGRAELSP